MHASASRCVLRVISAPMFLRVSMLAGAPLDPALIQVSTRALVGAWCWWYDDGYSDDDDAGDAGEEDEVEDEGDDDNDEDDDDAKKQVTQRLQRTIDYEWFKLIQSVARKVPKLHLSNPRSANFSLKSLFLACAK